MAAKNQRAINYGEMEVGKELKTINLMGFIKLVNLAANEHGSFGEDYAVMRVTQ